ncbi:hypothetical protein HY498_03515 [Candidatus Woesearchaeota archaeon]|nr:hypothetical protein [Candidatus Woesearchaeota archaeon]
MESQDPKPDLLEKRKEIVLNFLKTKKNWIFILLLLIVLYIGIDIRIQNLNLLKDTTTNDYIPADLDAMLFERYAKIIIEDGSLPDIDYKRNYPLGVDLSFIDSGTAYFSAYLYKISNFLNPKVTLAFTHSVLYPVIATTIGAIFFFLLIRLIFGPLTALLSTAFLLTIPQYLSRTVSGFSDKEPLGMLLIFAALYFYIKSLKTEKSNLKIIFALTSGILTGLLSLSWGGVIFVLTILPFTYLTMLLIKDYNKNDLFTYATWFIPVFITMSFLTTKYGGVKSFFTNYVFMIPLGVLIYSLIILLIKKNKALEEKISKKLPLNFAALIITIILASLILTLTLGFTRFTTEIMGFISKLSTQMTNRWAVTVAENHQPFFVDFISNFTQNYIYLALIGAIVLFWDTLKHIKKTKLLIILTVIFTLFLLSFTMSSYSESSTLNGENNISKLVYFGGIIFFIISFLYFYLKTYKNDQETFKNLNQVKDEYILTIIFFLVMIVAARTSVRFLFTLVPPVTIMASYVISRIYDFVSNIKYIQNIKFRKGLAVAFLIIIISIPVLKGSFIFFANSSYSMARGVGPIYNLQWQQAMKWVRENLPENAVFAHWWDYGYLVQDGADRATITDGGNVIIYWNHLLGRHVLLAQNETEALEFLYAHNATHLLIIDEELGKFPAYSSIGSDEKYDRYSILGTFGLDEGQSKETRNGNLLVYKGQSVIDQDFILNGKLIPEMQAAIIGFVLETQHTNQTNTSQKVVSFEQPKAVVYYQGKQFEVPVNCIYLQNQLQTYPKTENSFDGCIRFIPVIQQTQGGISSNEVGAFIYLSSKVRKTLFSQLYLLNNEKDWSHFKLVYDPSKTPNDYDVWSPFGIFSGRFIGPLRIWEIEYPKDIKFKPEYLETKYPNLELQIARR